MIIANVLLFSQVLMKLEGLNRVLWTGVHIDMPEYMQMGQVTIEFNPE